MIENTIVIISDKYYFTNLEKYLHVKLSINNKYIIGILNDDEIKLKELNIIENNQICQITLEIDDNNISIKNHININKLENFIKNGYPIPDRKYIFNILKKYYINYNIQNKQSIKFNKLINKNLDQYNNIELNNDIYIYDYQKKIIKWMIYIENNICNQYNYYPTNILKLNTTFINIKTGISYLNYDKKYFNISGGILIDEYYYGKATTTLLLCGINNINTLDNLDSKKIKAIQFTCNREDNSTEEENMKEYYIYNYRKLVSNANLIICPQHLIKQWKIDIENIYDGVKINIISNKKQFDLYTYEDLMMADFVIISINFLSNKNFKKIWKNYKLDDDVSFYECIDSMSLEYMRNKDLLTLSNPFISLIYWKRIIIDEFTELLNGKTYYIELVNSLNSVYKWYINNKIPENENQLYNLLNIVLNISDKKLLFDDNNYSSFFIYYKDNLISPLEFVKNLFVINKKDDVLKEIKLPNINEEIIMLEFSALEQILYKSYLRMYNENNINEDNDDYDIDYIYTYIYSQILDDMYNTLVNCKDLDEVRDNILNINKKNMIKYKDIKKKLNEKKTEFHKKLTLAKNEQFNDNIINQLFLTITELDENIIEIKKKIKDTKNHIKYYNNISNLARKLSDNNIIGSLSDNSLDNLSDNSLNNLSDNSLDNLSDDALDNSLYNSLNDINDKCSICLDKIKDNNLGITICGHIFCFLCIIESINYDKKCPYCRCTLDKKDIFKIINKKKLLKNKVKTDLDLILEKETKNKKMISKSAEIYTNNYLKKYCENLDYSNNYSCYDISFLIELYGVKIAHLIKYLFKTIATNNKEKIILYTKLGDNLINNINNILNQHNIIALSCYGTKSQKIKLIDKFNKGNYTIMIMSIKSVSLCINITGITKIIFLEPLFGDKDYVNNIEKQCLGLTYHLNKVSYLTIVRFIIKDSIEEKIYKQIYNP